MTPKQIICRLIFPLTVILFGTITKWWYVLPIDAPDTMMIGFPLAFISEGWHTSMSLQIFVFEFLVDFLFYFSVCSLLVFLVDRYLIKIKIAKWLTGVMWILSTAIFSVVLYIASFPEHIYEIKRDWDRQVMVTGFKFTWANQDSQDFTKYDINEK